MKSSSVLAAFAAVVVLAWADSAFAADRFLGSTFLTGVQDRDIILVPGVCPSPANPMVTSVKITVRRRPADIDHLEVRYGNGSWDELPVRDHFGIGSSSRWIDLHYGARCVEAIRIVGNSEAPVRQALVEVYGR